MPISKTSKMACHSWSLQAIEHCPQAFDRMGQLVDACRTCYATDGNYRFNNVKKVRADNALEWQEENWIEMMVAKLYGLSHFRWFDSGDLYSLDLAVKILRIMEATPKTKHWMPTRMHKDSTFLDLLTQMQQLPNVVIRLSSDSITGELVQHDWPTTSTIIPNKEYARNGVFVCPAPEQQGMCQNCRACWSKNAPVIAYIGHGRQYRKTLQSIPTVTL